MRWIQFGVVARYGHRLALGDGLWILLVIVLRHVRRYEFFLPSCLCLHVCFFACLQCARPRRNTFVIRCSDPPCCGALSMFWHALVSWCAMSCHIMSRCIVPCCVVLRLALPHALLRCVVYLQCHVLAWRDSPHLVVGPRLCLKRQHRLGLGSAAVGSQRAPQALVAAPRRLAAQLPLPARAPPLSCTCLRAGVSRLGRVRGRHEREHRLVFSLVTSMVVAAPRL